ncbi:hypothetical protein BIY37_04795 [Candidatus Brocadia sapporoensis]|uniref:Uncharacterized protein n=1 Tax=Candidatus Brocadia sapporoensis TaxID=392547 RepID=A0A1V6M162_9BACT|nr:hypothetical protein [Candidatus Brocadia sapporoensis]MDG6005552.1 hypothetical protein [Candidatus Brocadia sp.]OQD46142.1 hypothetical protein BIY37_04795 [Candidatus Brocadia sapporoensis]GJQ23573.1 MAG: hypothetical protein HBSAPP01_13630 [Candidatus Brocadia sapporoensis]
MTRNYLANYDLLAVSANTKETALNTEQTLDTSLLIDKSNILQLDKRRESNSDELTGKEEADTVYDLGSLSAATLDFPKAQAQHFAFGLTYGLGTRSTAGWGGGYKHTITPTSDITNPTFTAAMRLGSTILKRRFASNIIDTLTATFEKDAWAKLSLGIKGTGKYTDNVTTEKVTADYNATTFTLAANGVQGSTAALRLDNVHRIRVQVPATNEWKEVVYTVVSDATPAVITFTAPGGAATPTTYEIMYVPTEAAWCTFPARVVEPPLRTAGLVFKIGGKWDGSAFNGGRTLSAEVSSVEYNLNNQMLVEFRIGGNDTYANYILRQGRLQTLKLNREARDFILQQHMIDNEYFGVQINAVGAEFESGKNYYANLVFPRCNVLKAPLSVNGKVLAEAGDIAVLEDDTYGSVWAQVANKVATYGA